MERVTGIEPAWPAWKAGALPLSYTREVPAKDSQLARRTLLSGEFGYFVGQLSGPADVTTNSTVSDFFARLLCFPVQVRAPFRWS